jgi:hypothetical protein
LIEKVDQFKRDMLRQFEEYEYETARRKYI